MRSDNKADLEKLEARIRDSKDKALVRELLVRVQKLHRLTLAYHMFAVCSCNSRRSRRRRVQVLLRVSQSRALRLEQGDIASGSGRDDRA